MSKVESGYGEIDFGKLRKELDALEVQSPPDGIDFGVLRKELEALPEWQATASTPVQQEIADRSFFDRSALSSQETTESEVTEIANRFGVDAKELRSVASYFGADMEGSNWRDLLKEGAGFVGDVLFNVPQKLYKMSQDPKMEAALDELQNLTSGRKSYGRLAAETVSGPAGFFAKAATKTARAAGGALTGVVGGAASSGSGEELQGAAVGAALGGGAATILGQLTNRTKAKKLMSKDGLVKGDQLQKLSSEILQERKETYDLLNKAVAGEVDLTKLDIGTKLRIINQNSNPKTNSILSNSKSEKAINKELYKLTTGRKREVAKTIRGKGVEGDAETTSLIKDFISAQGGVKALQEMQEGLDLTRSQLEALKVGDIRIAPPGSHWVERRSDFMSDVQFVLEKIDESFGTRLGPALDDANTKRNWGLQLRKVFDDEHSNIFAEVKKDNAVKQAFYDGTIVKAIETGKIDELPENMQAPARRVKAYFEKAGKAASGETVEFVDKNGKTVTASIRRGENGEPIVTPLSITNVERMDYIPMKMVDPMEALSRTRLTAGAVVREASELLGRPVKSLDEISSQEYSRLVKESPSLKTLLDQVGFLADEPGMAFTSGRQLSNTIESLGGGLDTSGYQKMQKIASATQRREGIIPESLRENNVFKLMNSYTTSTIDTVHLRDFYAKIRNVIPVLEAGGDPVKARYLENFLSDQMGERMGTPASIMRSIGQDALDNINRVIEKHGVDSFPGRAAGLAKAMPSLLHAASMQIYPNLLGLSPRALIMNATQPFVKTMPGLGGGYGAVVTAKAIGKAYRQSLTPFGGFEKVKERVADYGLAPPDWTREMSESTAEGVLQSGFFQKGAKVVQDISDAVMYLYTRGDTVNRAIVIDVAEEMAADLAKGSQGAIKALGRAPTAIQRKVQEELAAGNIKEATATLAKHLNSTTQYNYNRLSMSEFGRTMGPLFSTFSKWPTATIGEIDADFRTKGLKGGSGAVFRKYMAPLGMLYAAGHAVHGPADEMSDVQKKLFGSQGLVGATPLTAIPSMLSGEMFSPPVLSAAGAIVRPAFQGDLPRVADGVATAANNFIPGAGIVRFLTDDVLTYIDGERPKGNFFERAIDGIDRL
jgi:hypothetical protein